MGLRKLAGSDGGEERPVGSALVEQPPDSAGGEPTEPERDAPDAFNAIVDRFASHGAVGDVGAAPVHDGGVPAIRGAADAAQLGPAVGVLHNSKDPIHSGLFSPSAQSGSDSPQAYNREIRRKKEPPRAIYTHEASRNESD